MKTAALSTARGNQEAYLQRRETLMGDRLFRKMRPRCQETPVPNERDGVSDVRDVSNLRYRVRCLRYAGDN